MKTTYRLKLDLSSVPKEDREAAKQEVADYILEQALEDVAKSRSPVTGRPFKRLSKEYKEQKKKISGSSTANLELFGDMLDSLKSKPYRDGIDFGIWDQQQSLKADNHNKFSAKSKRTKLPARKFIPNKANEEKFRPEIRREIQNIIKEFEE